MPDEPQHEAPGTARPSVTEHPQILEDASRLGE
jgi:hypothetical protein